MKVYYVIFIDDPRMTEEEILLKVIPALIGLVIGIVVNVVICFFISSWLNEVPGQYRVMAPGQVWLLIIPLFNLYWMFRVYMLDVPQSFKNYFDATGETSVGDCGKSLGQWICILTLVGCIPCVNYCSGIALLVMLILWLVKINELKQKIIKTRNQQVPVA